MSIKRISDLNSVTAPDDTSEVWVDDPTLLIKDRRFSFSNLWVWILTKINALTSISAPDSDSDTFLINTGASPADRRFSFTNLFSWINGKFFGLNEITGDSNVGINDNIIQLSSAGVIADSTATMPAGSTVQIGKVFTFENSNATYDLLIEFNGAETCEGVTQFQIFAGYDYKIRIYWNGTEWKRTERQLVFIPESSRPDTRTLNNGSETVTFTDVNFSAYVPAGTVILRLIALARMTGDGTDDGAYMMLRKNGSSETNTVRLNAARSAYTNLSSGVLLDNITITDVLCDSSGIVEYILTSSGGRAFLNIIGFWI